MTGDEDEQPNAGSEDIYGAFGHDAYPEEVVSTLTTRVRAGVVSCLSRWARSRRFREFFCCTRQQAAGI